MGERMEEQTTETGRTEVIHREELPRIVKEERNEVNGMIIKQKYIEVKGKTLQECKEIFDKIK